MSVSRFIKVLLPSAQTSFIATSLRRTLGAFSYRGYINDPYFSPPLLYHQPFFHSLYPRRHYNSDSSTLNSDIEFVESEGHVIRLFGLPWSVSVKDIHNFLEDCSIEEGDKGVVLTANSNGTPSGEAFVTLSSREDVMKALQHNREYIGSRYIEITRSSPKQMERNVGRSSQVSLDIGETSVVRLRGLPYRCEEKEIEEFFSGTEPSKY